MSRVPTMHINTSTLQTNKKMGVPFMKENVFHQKYYP